MNFELKPQSNGYCSREENRAFELIIESRRPAHALTRSQSVFLSADPDLIDGAGGYTDVIYEVAVKDPPEGSDLAWYSEAWCEFETDPIDMARIHELADAYWSGERYHNESQSNMEFRVPSAMITSVFELNVPKSELEKIRPLEELKLK